MEDIDLTMLARSAYRAILRSVESQSDDEAPATAPEDKEGTRGS
jgi:hypothetical protein